MVYVKSGTCTESRQISKMKVFANIANGFKPLTISAKNYVLEFHWVLNTLLVNIVFPP